MKIQYLPLHFRDTGPARQSGLSLIELMIALTLGILIVAALAELFVDISRANQEMAKTNSQIENARFAIQFLENDIVHAGYWGGYIPEFDDLTLPGIPTDEPTATGLAPGPCLAFGAWTAALGYEDAVIGAPILAFDTVPTGCSAIVTDRLANTDVLVVRHADTCSPGETNCEANNPGMLYFQTSNCQAEIEAGQGYILDPNAATLHERDCASTPPGTTCAAQVR